jgi:hypothetical protein
VVVSGGGCLESKVVARESSRFFREEPRDGVEFLKRGYCRWSAECLCKVRHVSLFG